MYQTYVASLANARSGTSENQPTIETGLKEQHHPVQLHQLEKLAVAEHEASLGHSILLSKSTILSRNSRLMCWLIRTGVRIELHHIPT
jgi:hypothetical protein